MAKVESITKFGFVADGKKYRYDEVSIDRAAIVPGADVLLEASGPVTDVNPPVDVERARKFTPKFVKSTVDTDKMSKAEWQEKDVRISRQGVIQAAVQALSQVLGSDHLFDEAEKLADKMLEYVNRK